MIRLERILVLLLVFGLIQSCTTQKRRSDRSVIAKAYDNTTARYNGFYNAEVLLAESEFDLNAQHVDNFNKQLVLYKYIAADNPEAVYPKLDKAIEKVGIVASQHKYSKWTDDCYLLFGKAQFLKKDYEGAEETLRYLVKEYSPAKLARLEKKAAKSKTSKKKKKIASKKKKSSKKKKRKRKKKKKKRPGSKKKKTAKDKAKADAKKAADKAAKEAADKAKDLAADKVDDPKGKGGLAHKPAWQEAQFWLAKTLIERDKDTEAFRILSRLEESPDTYKFLRDDLNPLFAYYYIKKKNLSQAVVYLEKGIETSDKKAEKARYAFLMGQLFQEMKNGDAAYAAFERALKFSTDYEMEFSSLLMMAKNAWFSGKETADQAIAKLEKMLKQSQNSEFKDQIYFAMAGIALQEGDKKKAMEYLDLSLASNLSNPAQKVEAYYQLGNLLYESEDYVLAKANYDETLKVMSKTDERHEMVTKRVKSLEGIVENIQLIALKDSLLTISEMSDDEKQTLAYEIKKKQDEAKRKMLEEQAKKEIISATGTARKKKSTFFGDDPKSIKRGLRDFNQHWGARNLEDDWRRSNKQSFSIDEDDPSDDEGEEELNDDDILKLLGNIPNSDAEKATFKIEIQKGLFTLGKLYREKIQNYDKSIIVLTELLDKYPKTSFKLDALYLMYLNYLDKGEVALRDQYKNRIIQDFPNSDYAKILIDPSYADKFLAREKKENLEYDRIYGLFEAKQFEKARTQGLGVFSSLPAKHQLKPKYSLLLAMCTGALSGKEDYIKELQKVVATYPGSAEQKRAKEMLRLLGVKGAKLPGGADEADNKFTFKEKELHYMIIIFNEPVKLSTHKNKVSDFNRKFFKGERIRISNVYLGKKNDTPVLVLRRFTDVKKVMAYYNAIKKNKSEFIDNDIDYTIFPISQSNYRNILKAKSLSGYADFFEENYLE